jgi:rare lipoprotein A
MKHARNAAGLCGGLLVAATIAGCSSLPERDTRESGRGAEVPVPPPDVATIPDAVPRAEPRSRYGNPPFYEVFGKRYHLLPTAAGYVETGYASWYGPGFHAETTSSGEPYDMYAMTAAHKTLPIPAYARVTNLENGRSIVVRINDRGPFVDGRIIDLSYTAAAKLDMIRAGTARVEVKVVGPETTPVASGTARPTAAAANPGTGNTATAPLFIQAGAFSDPSNARGLIDRLSAAGIDLATVRQESVGGRRLHRVRIGPIGSTEEFDRIMARLAEVGVASARLAGD